MHIPPFVLAVLYLTFFAVYLGPKWNMSTAWMDCQETLYSWPFWRWHLFDDIWPLTDIWPWVAQEIPSILKVSCEVPETVAGRCPMWMMAKIKRTCIHTSAELLKERSKGWICFFLISFDQHSLRHVNIITVQSDKQTLCPLTLNNRFFCRVVTVLLLQCWIVFIFEMSLNAPARTIFRT